MLIKTVSYTDYNNNPQTDTLYFNLSKAEIAALQVKMDGKFIDYLKDLTEKKHVEELFHIFRDLVLDSYGVKSEDGKRFIKTAAAREEFESSIAFSEILTELITSGDNMAAFTRGVIPPDFAANLSSSDVAVIA